MTTPTGTGRDRARGEDRPLPALFFGHGSPMNAIERNASTDAWRAVGASLAAFGAPRAVLCVSAHWLTRGSFVAETKRPKTIHDFGGFPEALYEIDYPAPGAPDVARRVQHLAGAEAVGPDTEMGLDHGTWSVLRHVFPDADVPVLQLSIDVSKSPEEHLALARSLAPLRDEGVLVTASGNVVHNLRAAAWRDPAAPPHPWAVDFDAFVAERVAADDVEALLRWASRPDARLAHPTEDHWLPIYYALGVRRETDAASFFAEGIAMASVGMRGIRLG